MATYSPPIPPRKGWAVTPEPFRTFHPFERQPRTCTWVRAVLGEGQYYQVCALVCDSRGGKVLAKYICPPHVAQNSTRSDSGKKKKKSYNNSNGVGLNCAFQVSLAGSVSVSASRRRARNYCYYFIDGDSGRVKKRKQVRLEVRWPWSQPRSVIDSFVSCLEYILIYQILFI